MLRPGGVRVVANWEGDGEGVAAGSSTVGVTKSVTTRCVTGFVTMGWVTGLVTMGWVTGSDTMGWVTCSKTMGWVTGLDTMGWVTGSVTASGAGVVSGGSHAEDSLMWWTRCSGVVGAGVARVVSSSSAVAAVASEVRKHATARRAATASRHLLMNAAKIILR